MLPNHSAGLQAGDCPDQQASDASLSEPRLRQPLMPLSVFPVVVPVTPFVVTLVMPLIGSLPAPFAAIGKKATDGQAEYDRADAQEEKTSFHVGSRVGCLDGHASDREKSAAISVRAGRFWRNRCCLEKDGFDGSGSPDHRGPKRLARSDAVFDPIVKFFIVNYLNSSEGRLEDLFNHNGAAPSSF